MKKIYTMLMMAIMALAFTSCEDEMIADTLEGTWSGNMYISSNWDGRTYDITRTEITFEIDPFRFTKGSGKHLGTMWPTILTGLSTTGSSTFISSRITTELRSATITSTPTVSVVLSTMVTI